MTPSKFQQDIMDWLQLSDGNAIIKARAGSGKTSTLVMLSDLLPDNARAIFLAFNKSIQVELSTRLPRNVECATFHSACMRALKRSLPKESAARDWVQGSKMQQILDDMTAADERITDVRNGILKLIGLMKANMLLPDCAAADIVSLIDEHEIDFEVDNDWITPADILAFTREALQRSNDQTRYIDFDDMLYMTATRNCVLQKYTHIFIDEAQDTNKVQRVLLERMLGRTGRLIAVGDESQAIYGFRGADSTAMQQISTTFNCTPFPLSVSYRCATAIVELAQTIEPDIQARDNAPQGLVSTLDAFKVEDFQTEDFVVCRNTAPVVALAFKMIRAHKPVRVLGRDIGQNLIALIKKMRANTLEELDIKIRAWSDREYDKAISKRLEAKAQRIQDQCDTIVAMCEGMPENERTVSALVQRINELFSENGNAPRTTLSTIHKAKGREANRVFILDPYLMPSKYAKLPWQQLQERNLRYVAITRALNTLHFIRSEAIA